MNQVLYRKWRPQTWDEVVGQNHVVQTLCQAVAADRIAHAYLFSGPRGTGKTSMARILARAANCLAEKRTERPCNACSCCRAVNEGAFLDLIEIDAASNTSVEDVRELRERVLFAPAEGRCKVYIIDEVHMLSSAAFNALLKTLEEPPAHVLFVLATTEVQKIPATVLSRCQRHEFRRLSVEEIVGYLEKVAREEGLRVEHSALEVVARQATGSMRDAISLLDQLGSLGEAVSLERTLDVLGAAESESVQQLAACISNGDVAGGLQILHRVMDSGADARQFARQMVDYLRGVMMAGSGNADLVEVPAETRAAMKTLAAEFSTPAVLRAIRAFSQAASDSRTGWRPQLPLELAFIDSTLVSPAGEDSDARAVSTGGGSSRASVERKKPTPGTKAAVSRPSESAAVQRKPASATEDGKTSSAGTLTLPRVAEVWDRILANLRERDSRTHALFAAAQVRSLEDGELCLSLPSDLIQQKCSRRETLTVLQGVLAEVLGQSVRVRCTVVPAGKADGRSGASGGPGYVKGGMVDVATNELGAHVVDIP